MFEMSCSKTIVVDALSAVSDIVWQIRPTFFALNKEGKESSSNHLQNHAKNAGVADKSRRSIKDQGKWNVSFHI